jgi:hypothetical protein
MSDPVRDLKQELLAAAERQHGHAPGQASRRRLGGLSSRSRLVMAAATLAIAAAVALLATAPWDSSPGFLARAQAALTRTDTVLHMKMETTSTWTRPICTVTRSRAEAWIDGTPPHSYRVLLNDFPPDPVNADPPTLACSSGTASEYGGTYELDHTLRFVPPNRLSANAFQFRFALDPAADLRAAISTGRAHDEGKTQLDGRTIERVRIDPPLPSACPRYANCGPRGPVYVYVDPETFYPVAFGWTTSQVEIVGGPGGSSYRQVRVRDLTRYLTFEYLPRTAANLALTDIHAQHPNATGP